MIWANDRSSVAGGWMPLSFGCPGNTTVIKDTAIVSIVYFY